MSKNYLVLEDSNESSHIELTDTLNRKRKLSICMADISATLCVDIDEQQAMDLVCHIIKVFHIPNSDIEVIHFPPEVDRAEVLRLAADRIDAGLLDPDTREY